MCELVLVAVALEIRTSNSLFWNPVTSGPGTRVVSYFVPAVTVEPDGITKSSIS